MSREELRKQEERRNEELRRAELREAFNEFDKVRRETMGRETSRRLTVSKPLPRVRSAQLFLVN